jgi:hypothetical protein
MNLFSIGVPRYSIKDPWPGVTEGMDRPDAERLINRKTENENRKSDKSIPPLTP